MNSVSRAVRFVFFLLAFSAGSAVLAADHKHVILLHSFGTEMRPWSDYAQGIREELNRQSPWPLTITDQSVVSARYIDINSEKPFVDYLSSLFAHQPLDVIVSVGAPAAAFVQRNRSRLFTSTPMVLTTLEQRRIQYSDLTQNDAVVPIQIDYKAVLANILQVLPDTRHIAVVNGVSPNEQFWSGLIRKEAISLADRIKFTFLDNLSFDDILKEAAHLPPHSAIVWEGMSVDAAGVVHDGDDAFKRLRAVSNAPIFGYTEPLIGLGVVGGPFNAVSDTSRTAAAVVVRILGGAKAGDIRISPLPFSVPRFDWREMKRWGISDSHLPPGSKIDFREPAVWEAYRWQILLIAMVMLTQAALITKLLYEHRRRQFAEVQVARRSSELAHVNRCAMAGELTASIAHEINQPLGAIRINAETAQVMLNSPTPDLKEIKQILSDIHRDDQRAGEVIVRLRSLLKKAPFELRDLDLNELVGETVDLLSRVAAAREVKVDSVLTSVSLPIKGDRVQLQQVIVNLVINAMDAMSIVPSGQRSVKLNTVRSGDFAEVSVSDVGPGVPPEKLKEVFEPFFTTKSEGMGMGLSIARTIVQAHSGHLQAENKAGGGAIFYFRLPLTAVAE